MLPHDTTVPSLFNAANADPVEKIWATMLSPAGVVPPLVELPQEMTVPSLFRAAKAF